MPALPFGSATPPLDTRSIENSLGEAGHLFDIRVLPECDSTNSILMQEAAFDPDKVQVVAAEIQHAGRGRRGREWQTWPGGSLTFSLRWSFAKNAPAPAGLSLVAGLGVARVLEALGIIGVQLKWPNDVQILSGKLAGILVELQHSHNRAPTAIIGIGINMRIPETASAIPEQAHITDIASHLPTPPDRNRLLAALLTELHVLLSTYSISGFPALQAAWQQRNAFASLPVQIIGENSTLNGICAGVDGDGALLLQTESDLIRILSGEVSLRAAR